MRIEQIRSFTTVYETGSFTAAARQLYTEQPVITKHISQLENELGCSLFTRTTRKVAPTQAGELFYGKAREALLLLDRGIADVKMLAVQAKSELRIGYTYLYMDQTTVSWPKEFESTCAADIRVSLSEAPQPALLDQITNGDIDGAFVGVTSESLIPSYMGRLLVLTMGEVIVVGKTHPFVQRESVSVNDLLGADLIYPAQAPTADLSIVMKDFEELGKQPHTRTTQFESSALRIVSMGHAIIDLPEKTALESDDFVRIPYRSKNKISYYFVWNSGNTGEAFSRFLDYVHEKTASIQEAR